MDIDTSERSTGNKRKKRRVEADESITTDSKEFERKVRDVIRFCLLRDSKKLSISRGDLRQITGAVSFETVWSESKARLSRIFGYEVLDWPSKCVSHAKSKKSSNTSTSDLFSFKSIFSQDSIVAEQKGVGKTEEEMFKNGLLPLVLSFVYLNNGMLKISSLHEYLKSFGFHENNLGKWSSEIVGHFDSLLDGWIKQGYFEKFNKSSSKEPFEAEILWGPRAKVEWDKEVIVSFIMEFLQDENLPASEFHSLKRIISKTGKIQTDSIV